MEWIKYGVVALLMTALELLYFRVAVKYGIVDHPNDRTLHIQPTIRGGGIIFLICPWIYQVFFGGLPLWLVAGISIIGITSLADDIRDLPNRVRLSAQFLAVSLAFWQAGVFNTDTVTAILFLVVAVGAINAYNFMDGINGITGGYSLIALTTMLIINEFYQPFAPTSWLVVLIIAVLIFNYFNFRNKARCFAGDVGSITIAFIIVYHIVVLILQSGSFLVILLLSVYGVDSVLTIVHRIFKGENIFRAHRSHLFQVIVFHGNVPHLKISLAYMAIQGFINLVVLYFLNSAAGVQIWAGAGILLILALAYIIIKSHYVKVFPATG